MTQDLFLYAIRAQPRHVTFLTAKAIVRKKQKNGGHGVAVLSFKDILAVTQKTIFVQCMSQ